MKIGFLLCFISMAYAIKPLPPYIKPCARTDPHFDQCALERAKEIIPVLIKGDRKYKVPILEPFEIKEIKIIDQGPRTAVLKLTVKDAKIYGVKDIQLHKIHFDFSKDEVSVDHDVTIPRLMILSKYDISGNILVLPIRGNGNANITLVDATTKVKAFYDLKEMNGRTFMVFRTMTMPLKVSTMYTHLTNLFGGNKLLGDEMNRFINNNWEEVFQEMYPTIIEAFRSFVIPIMNNIITDVPFDESFPETIK